MPYIRGSEDRFGGHSIFLMKKSGGNMLTNKKYVYEDERDLQTVQSDI